MGYDPPGLEHRPDDKDLIGFGSLMPAPEKKPGVVGRVLRLPGKILALPFRLIRAILRLPLRLFGRGQANDGSGT